MTAPLLCIDTKTMHVKRYLRARPKPMMTDEAKINPPITDETLAMLEQLRKMPRELKLNTFA